MKVLILGGTGFLGTHVKKLLEQRPDVEVFSASRNEGTDVRNFAQFSEKLKEVSPDGIINCAAHVGGMQYVRKHAADTIYDNVQMVLNIYKAVADVCPATKVINPLSNCSYPGEANIHIESEWQNGPVHPTVLGYGSTKRILYAVAESFSQQYGIKSVNWLVPNGYGPGDHIDPERVHALNGILIRLIQAQKKGDATFEIWGTGKPTREWGYIEDVARIMVQSLEIDSQVYPINFAQNRAYSITEIATLGAKALNYDVEFVFNTQYPDGAPTKILDDHEFRSKYPEFQFTPLELGIRKTIEYYKAKLA